MLGRMEWPAAINRAFAEQVGRLFIWAAVAFGSGTGVYFRLPFEPQLWSAVGCLCCSLILTVMSRHNPIVMLGAIVVVGYGWAATVSHWHAAPVLEKRIYGDISGRVVMIDVSASGKPRITLDRVETKELPPYAQPERVRIALHGPSDVPPIGSHVQVTAHVSPPPGPAEPGGFDFQRHAWFLSLGGVGYTRKVVQIEGDPEGQTVARVRAAIGFWIRDHVPGNSGGIATAITTGDRAYLDPSDVTALRQSNLAHLLAISGLHMGLLVGLVFTIARLCCVRLKRFDAKKIAAGVAMVAATAYLMISGASIATERAFIMSMVILGAILARRRALTLRAVALAAVIVLILRPQAIFSPGFHMSFAATTALVIAFQFATDRLWFKGAGWRRAVIGAVLSSAVAGLATAPYAAAHFNQVPHYGLVANLLAVPLMGIVVMPGLLAAVLLAPFGLEFIGFFFVDQGLQLISAIAHHVAQWPGSVSQIKAPSPWTLPLFTLGAIIFLLWIGKGRVVGVAVCAVSLVLWWDHRRPDILIADSALLVGVMGPAGRQMSRDKGAGFAARIWLENDGDTVSQSDAAARNRAASPTISVLRKADAMPDVCESDIYVVADYLRNPPCDVFDLRRLRNTGSVAGYLNNGQIDWISAKDISGRRLWNDRWVRRDALALWPFASGRDGLPR